MTGMIERIAEGQARYDGRSLIGMSRSERDSYKERARLMVLQMAIPTERMIAASVEWSSRTDIYLAFIQAALDEGE